MDPTLWQPYLDGFLKDKLLPNAILIEYIPNMKMMDLSTFSPSRMQKLVSILKEMHEAKIYYRDVYPRNMMVVPESPERILWMDFDRSQTYSGPLTERQEGWIQSETRVMNEFARLLVSLVTLSMLCIDLRKKLQAADYKEGKLKNAWHFYYE